MANGLYGLHNRLLSPHQASTSCTLSQDLVRSSCGQHDGKFGKTSEVERLNCQRRSKRCRLSVRADSNESLQDSFGRQPSQPAAPPTFIKAPGKVIAVGDIHGDLQKTFLSLALAGVLREGTHKEPIWCGGDSTVVQLGDVLDRGAKEIAVILLLRELDRQAREQGGAVYMLNGNHESLNVSGHYRYASEEGMAEAAQYAGYRGEEVENKMFQARARARLYSPGQPMALELAKNPTALIVNNTLFAHGGVLPEHVAYGLERINAEVAAWMRGDILPGGKYAQPPFQAMGGSDSIMWTRLYGKEAQNPYERYTMCQRLRQTLSILGVEQMVIGHTPQAQGANCECNGQVWRVDVGMSSGVLNAIPQVLEISQDSGTGKTKVKLLTAPTTSLMGSSRMCNSMAPLNQRAPVPDHVAWL